MSDFKWGTVTGAGLFVAVAYTGTNRVMTSPDGVSWTSRSAAEANQWFSVTYGAGLFVAVAGDGTNQVMTSPDGVSWTSRSAAETNGWRAVTYGAGLFVAVAVTGSGNRVMTSPDGVSWTSRSAAEANQWHSITYGAGLFVAVAYTGTNRVMTSPDGVSWTSRSAAEANQWFSVTYGAGLFVAVAGDGTNQVMTSPDGVSWTSRSAAEANGWFSVTYGAIPLRIKLDGDTIALPFTPDSLVDPLSLAVDDRVRCELSNRRVIIVGRSQGVSIPSGNIEMTARATAPGGWLLCQGQAISRTTYASLFADISTAYGTGDGSTTFNVPDFRGRVPVGLDSSQTEFDALGEAYGAKTHTLTVAEMPTHAHSINAHDTGADQTSGGNRAYLTSGGANDRSTRSTGGGGAHNNVQPSRVVNFIIKT
ncbi:tail fiber protein [Cryobacterium sp. Y62]|uniref:tail fiber protein n=1 Tax=Cryobacterium sp. Y62 TaxID=2048284 RepID=UPI000CE3D78C|nr:tail fiber protein [Cryobacterium sp. Y62]